MTTLLDCECIVYTCHQIPSAKLSLVNVLCMLVAFPEAQTEQLHSRVSAESCK